MTVNEIENDGARMIGEVLKSNSTLTKLDLTGDLKNSQKLRIIKSICLFNDAKVNRQQNWK